MLRLNNKKNILISRIIIILIVINIIPLTSSLPIEKQNAIYNNRNIILNNDNDTTPPVTTIKIYGYLGENGWYVRLQGIKLVATDDLSGVNKTYYSINGGENQTYTKMFSIYYDGIYVIEYYSVDNAGNVEDVKSAELKLDQMCPGVFVDFQKLGFKKWKFIVQCYDGTSGMDRVEFYYDDNLEFIDYDKPYEWIWNDSINLYNHKFNIMAYDKAGNKGVPLLYNTKTIVGIIYNPKITEDYISFFAIKVWILTTGEIISFKNFTISTFGFSGHVGKFFIFANCISYW